VSGLLALLICLAGVVYAAWPWLRGRAWRVPTDEDEVRVGEDMDSIEKALREWSVAAGEIGVGALAAIEGESSAEVRGE
jgi:hypothetical protein